MVIDVVHSVTDRAKPSTLANVVALGVVVLVVGGLAFLLRSAPSSTQFAERPITTLTAGEVGGLYDPVRAGEPLPEGFRQLLPRDGISPVYQPEFVEAAQSTWGPDTLVVGVAIDADARAYPVDFLNHREMVIDSVAGIPVLVTW